MEIRFRGSINKDEFLHLMTLAARPVRPGLTVDFWVLLAGGGAAMLALGAWATGQPRPDNGLIALMIAFGVMFMFVGFTIGSAVHRTWDSNPPISDPREGVITDQQIEVHYGFIDARVPWSEMQGYGEYKDILLIGFRGEGFFFSPRFFETDADWQRFRTMVKERLPVRYEVKGFSLKFFLPQQWNFRQIFVYILIAIAVIVMVATALKPERR